jgi:hypothetical protein
MMYQQLWGYKVEDKLYLEVREQKRLNTTDLGHCFSDTQQSRTTLQAVDVHADHLPISLHPQNYM